MIGRLVQAADFQRLLAVSPRQRSTHFVVHYVRGEPVRPHKPVPKQPAPELSTDTARILSLPVDKSPEGRWLGCVVPKRHAKRSVTRTTLKRQIRAAADRHEAALPTGLWLVRLRQPFAVRDFPSADSPALRAAARAELDALFARAAR